MINKPATTRIIIREVKNTSDKLLIRAMNLITDPTDKIISWYSHLFWDTENETDVNPDSNFILFNDSDVIGLVNWFQGLSNLDYRQRRYTLSLVIECHVDQEVLVSFLNLTSENAYHLRKTRIFADAVYDSFYNN